MAGVQNPKPDEFVVRVPKIVASKTKKIAIFKFNSNLNVDVTQWSANNVSLSREDNESTFIPTDNQPKTGIGSEFGRQMREEARRKKLGYGTTKYSRDDQPWLLSVNSGSGPSKSSKKYRGIREGGVAQNADFWVFVKAGDGIFDAYPVNEWYNFLPVARYKTLDVEEAEEQFSKRNKILNQFALKIKQKLEGEKGTNEDTKNSADSEASKDKKRGKAEDGDDGGISSKKASKAGKKGKKKAKKPKKRKETGDEDDLYASADSDDGDDEGREVDYMSDSDLSISADEEQEEVKVRGALIGVDEEDGMQKLIASEDENEENEQEEEGEEKKKFEDFAKMESMPTIGADAEDKASDSGSDSDDPDEDLKSPFFMQDVKTNADSNGKKSAEPGSSNLPSNSRTSADNLKKKSTLDEGSSLSPPAKRAKTDKDAAKSGGVISEVEVRRYLQRKPQSSKDLVAKFKPKCLGMSKSDVVKCLADILKRLNPEQFERNGTMFFSMKK